MLETILRYIMLYFIIISGSIFVKYKTNRKLASSIPIYILTVIVILYIFGLFKGLLIGTYIISIASILFGIYAIIKMTKDERKEIIDAGTIFFTIIYCVFMITTYEKVSNTWDEYSYWSLTTKQMYYTNIFRIYGYPPMPNIWEYFVCKVIGKYTQGIEFFGLYMFSFSLLLPLFEIKKNKSKIYNFCLGIICLCLPGIFAEMYFYVAPYADAILGLILGYIFIESYIEKDSKLLKYILSVAFISLVLTKATGVYLALIIVVTYLLIKAFNELKYNKKIKLSNYKIVACLIAVVLITYSSWNIYSKINSNKSNTFEIVSNNTPDTATVSDLVKSCITVAVKSTKETLTFDIIQENLVTSIIKGTAVSGYIKLSIGGFVLAYFAVLLLLYKKEKTKKCKNIILFIGISLALYILFLQVAYFLKFNITEALSHNSFSRYVSSYLLAMLILLVAIILNNDKEKSAINIVLLMIIVLAITPLKDLTNATINAGFYNMKINKEINEMVNETDKLKQNTPDNSKLYIVNQQLEDNKFKYFMLPENDVTMGIYFGNSGAQNEKEQFKRALYESYEYVYIRATDEYFNNNYSEMFNDTIEEKAVYKINKDNGMENIKLERIDSNE